VEWVFGTPIGAASSNDGGHSWQYRGTLDLRVKKTGETFWGPEIVYHDGLFHLFPAYYEGVRASWDTKFMPLAHFTSKDLRVWQFEGLLPLEADHVIEGSIHRMANGRWRMWYRRDIKQEITGTWVAESENLCDWKVLGPAVTDMLHEGAKVFELGGYFWMVVDPWKGLAVYRSDDGERWSRQGGCILEEGGSRVEDRARAHNTGVLVLGDVAYLIYHTHPQEHIYQDVWTDRAPFALRRSVIQVAEARVKNGRLVVERDNAHLELPRNGPKSLK
jgi:hypothetical protein